LSIIFQGLEVEELMWSSRVF